MSIAIIDYGAGNLRSISNACAYLGKDAQLISDPEQAESADVIILPGVGHFGDAMGKLKLWKPILLKKINEGVPFLGICLGIQVIFEESDESKAAKGLGMFKGRCVRFSGVKCPHMGWNDIKIIKEIPILKGIKRDYFYFVHSYYVVPEDKEIIAASTEYGVEFPSVIAKGNVFATQFHPEADSHVFELRINIYKDKGYFPREQANKLIEECHQKPVHLPEAILRNFVRKYLRCSE